MSDQTPDRPPDDDLLQDVLAVISELARKSAGGDYLYRGEPECYPKVSSGLYRKYRKIAGEDFDVGVVQFEMLLTAKQFIGNIEEDDDDLLDQLQHFGYTTNLIDFTTDVHIALFFACDGHTGKDGRVILLNKTYYPLRRPRGPANRVIAQKSVFVLPPKGFVEPSDVVVVPSALKDRILRHLDLMHGVAPRTVYNDLHGFIRYHGTHDSAYAAFYEALAHQKKGDLEATIKHFSKSIDLNPRHPVSHLYRGDAYATKGNYDVAIHDYDRAIELNPRYAEAYTARGVAYGDKGEQDRALRDHNRAIELDPHLALAYNNRAIILREQGDHDGAITDCDRALELDPHLALAFSNRATAHGSKGDYDRAIMDCDRAIQLNPRLSAAYTNRGIAYASKGDYDLAIQDHNIAIELDKHGPLAHNSRGNAYLGKGDYNSAIQDYDRVIELDPYNAGPYVNRSTAYRKLGYFGRAVQDCHRAIGLNPRYALAYYKRAESLLYLEDWNRAESDLSIAQSLGFDIVSVFANEFGGVPAFEQTQNVNLPESLARILTRPDQA